MVVPISSPHGPCLLSDGTVLYVGKVFAEDGRKSAIACYTVDKNGACTFRSRIPDIGADILSCEPYAYQLKNGRILVHIRAQRADGSMFTLYQCISDDMGYSFTVPMQILSDRGGAPAHIIEHSSGIIVSVYGYRCLPYGIRTMISRDGGESWESDFVLVDSEPTPDLGYPSSVELANGDILTVYYSRVWNTDAPQRYLYSTSGEAVLRQVVWSLER